MSEELIPCAHCGGQAIISTSPSYVECSQCYMSTPIVSTIEGAIKRWNTRQSPESEKIQEAMEGAESLINSLGVHHEYLTTQFLNSGEYDSRLPKKGMSEERFMKIDAMINMYITKSLYIKSILEAK